MQSKMNQDVKSNNTDLQQNILTDYEKNVITFKMNQLEEYLIIAIVMYFIGLMSNCLICIYTFKEKRTNSINV
jgi:hypothetical protein